MNSGQLSFPQRTGQTARKLRKSHISKIYGHIRICSALSCLSEFAFDMSPCESSVNPTSSLCAMMFGHLVYRVSSFSPRGSYLGPKESPLRLDFWADVNKPQQLPRLWRLESAHIHHRYWPLQKLAPLWVVESGKKKEINGRSTTSCTPHTALNITIICLIITPKILNRSWFLYLTYFPLFPDPLYLPTFQPFSSLITRERLKA